MLFADAKYDAPYEGAPRQTYLIAGARRTGSTYLGQLLWETGQLGKPFEYLLLENRSKIMERVPEGMDYFDFLRRMRTTANGVFATKEVAPSQYRLYRTTNPKPDHVIYITRRDEVDQAISLTIALQTEAFFSFQQEKRESAYDYWAIMNNFIHICEIKRAWEDIFIEEGFSPLRLVYEDIGPDVVEQIADHIGVKLSNEKAIAAPYIHKQGNNRNKEWGARFRKEMNEQGCLAP